MSNKNTRYLKKKTVEIDEFMKITKYYYSGGVSIYINRPNRTPVHVWVGYDESKEQDWSARYETIPNAKKTPA